MKLPSKEFWKTLGLRYLEAFKLFGHQRATALASASSFYIILTVVPFFLLLIRLVGFFLGDMQQIQNLIFELGENIFPDVAPEILYKVKSLVEGPLKGGAQFTIINFMILTISSLSFFNMIWSGLYLISGDRSHLSLWKHVKGLVIIMITVVILIVAFSIHPVILFTFKVLNHNFLTNYLWENFEAFRPVLDYFRTMDLKGSFLFRSNFLYFFLFLFYFSFVYRWFFSWKIRFREALLSSATFVLLLLLGKNLFWIYFLYVRKGLIESYGDFYTFIVGIIWIFLVMSFFFFGACLCVVFQRKPLFEAKEPISDTISD